MTSDLLEEIKVEYDLCINKPEEYEQKVDRISSLFSQRKKEIKGRDLSSIFIWKISFDSICNLRNRPWQFTFEQSYRRGGGQKILEELPRSLSKLLSVLFQ